MARYIDEELLMQKLSRMIDYCKTDQKVNGLTALFQVGDAIMDCPTADVVPKSEVERLNKKIDELKRDRYQVFPDGRIELLPRTDLDKIKDEVAREIFEDLKKFCRPPMPECKPLYIIRESELAELKKKYTKEKE